jgi:hypothetical protein
MNLFIRSFICFIIFTATNFFSYWLLFVHIMPESAMGLAGILSLALGLCAAVFIWRRTGAVQAGLLSAIFNGAVILGSIGFVGGFFGPMLIEPGANQGPLLGLFITGPLGFLFGAVFGAVRWFWRCGRAKGHLPDESA